MLSKKAKYALLAMIHLAEQYDGEPVLISEIAQQENIPKKFLELILLDLKNHGLLRSKKGRGGGYSLGRPPNEITVGEVVRTVDGPLAPVPCVSKMAYGRCEECLDERICGVRLVMQTVRDSIAGILDSTTFHDVLRKVEKAKKDIGLGGRRR